jgi:hypothetical protein
LENHMILEEGGQGNVGPQGTAARKQHQQQG